MRFGVAALVLAACSTSYGDARSDAAAPVDASSATTDAGAVSDAADAAAADASPPPGCLGALDCERIVFVTSETTDGTPGDAGGLEGADALCQRLADASSRARGRRFRAFLSTGTTPASGRVPKGTKPYRRTDDAEIAASLEELLGAGPKVPMNVDENGDVVASAEVWTGSAADGDPIGDHCSGWTTSASAALGRVGNAARSDSHWANDLASACNAQARLYCFEN